MCAHMNIDIETETTTADMIAKVPNFARVFVLHPSLAPQPLFAPVHSCVDKLQFAATQALPFLIQKVSFPESHQASNVLCVVFRAAGGKAVDLSPADAKRLQDEMDRVDTQYGAKDPDFLKFPTFQFSGKFHL